MSKQIAVIGLGRYGGSLCTELSEQGASVLAIDCDEKAVKKVSGIVAQAVIADATDPMVIDELKLQNYQCVFVSIGHDINASILITLALKDAGIQNVCVKSKDHTHSKILEKLGADHILNPEYEMAKRVSRKFLTEFLYDFIDLSGGLAIYEMALPEKLIDCSVSDLKLRDSIKLLSLNRGEQLFPAPEVGENLQKGDILILGGQKSELQHLLQNL